MYSDLHGHTHFSNLRLLDSTSKPEQVLDKAHELDLFGVAFTDHDCLSSFVSAEKYLTKKKAENPEDEQWQKMRLIRGNEIYLVRNGLTKDNIQRGEEFFHFILIAKDYTGYQQLCELSARAWRRSFKYYQLRVPTYYQDIIDVIGANPGHVIGSTACLGSQLGSKILKYKEKEISRTQMFEFCEAWILRMKEIFGEDHFYLELQPGVSDEQIFVNQTLYELAVLTSTPTIITTDHHYTEQKDRDLHRAYLQSRNEEREVDAFYEATYMMTEEEIYDRMYESFDKSEQSYDIIKRMLLNTNQITNMCEDYSLLSPLKLPYIPTTFDKVLLNPESPLTQKVRKAMPNLDLFIFSDEYANQQFAARIYYFMLRDENGTARWEDIYKANRMNTELGIIWESGKTLNVHWSRYLLQVSDYLEIFWTLGDSIVAPSRGSAGASYSCHALGINQIDPTKEKAPLIFERFMNPERASVLDIDSDVQANRRDKCIEVLGQTYGFDNVTRVSTFKTEKARSAILTAARSLGIDVDIARHIASLCKAPRGIPYTLTQMYYGDIEEELAPNKEFINQISKYERLWEVASGIEGLINGLGVHAGGVIITETPIQETCGIMRTSSGEIVTAYDLHECEDLSLIKIDLLATEGLSKIRCCLDLLIEHGYIENQGTLKDNYNQILDIYKLEKNDPKMWEMVWNNEIISLFQMEQQSGVQGIALTKPKTLEDLATLNSVIRLMPPDRKSERPLEKFARFKEDLRQWDYEMEEYGLNNHERELMHQMFDYSSGVAAQQEDLYQLLTHPEIVGWGWGQADKVRKAVAKKNPQDFKELEEEFFEDVQKKKTSPRLAQYVWGVLIASQRGYSFNLAHCLSYSYVALQEMNLAYKYPIIFWNTANLIIDSGAEFILDEEDEEDLLVDNEEEAEEEKKGTVVSRYGKIASAIGRMQQIGITILPPDINESNLIFTPDVNNDVIRYGLRGISRVGINIVEEIIKNRPYSSLQDFLNKVKVNKLQAVSLIKSGAFDSFEDRAAIMEEYIYLISPVKNTVNLRNVNMLMEKDLFPKELDFELRVFRFNKSLRKGYDKSGWLYLDENHLKFYSEFFDIDKLQVSEDGDITKIAEPYWKNIYDSYMNTVRNYIKSNHDDLLFSLNQSLTQEMRDKYALGSLSKWSMDAVNFYQDEHELAHANLDEWNVIDFWSLPEEPVVSNRFRTREGTTVEMYHLSRIAGTVIDKDTLKSQITLLTTGGVVIVQAYGVMSAYDKQISEVQPDGKKKIVERSMFTRGTKIIVNGMRRGEHTFIAKKYARDQGHHFMRILEIKDDGSCVVQENRTEVE